MTKGRVIAVAAAAILFFVAAQTVSAQYPPPKGNLVCVLSQTNATAEGTLVFAATYRDSAGAPVVGKVVGFEVVSQDGRARLNTSNAITNASGTASVNVLVGGSTGQITIKATSDELECRGVAEVLGVSVFRPPATGDAGLVEFRDNVEALPERYLVLAAVFAGLIFLSFLLVFRQE